MKILLFICLLILCFDVLADIFRKNGVYFGNTCRFGNIFSVRFEPEYYLPVGSKCNVLTIEGKIFTNGVITHE